jgi:ATP-dependent Clp protease protease subunit
MSRIVVSKDNFVSDLTSMFVRNRVIWLFDSIDDRVAQDLCQQLVYLNQINQTTIYLNIQSGGGSVYSAFSIIGTMQTIKSPVHVHVCGFAASAAALITLFGSYRTALPYSTLMFHQVISSNPSQTSYLDTQIQFAEITRLNTTILKMIHSRLPHMTFDEIKQFVERDNFLDAYQALQMKIIDEIYVNPEKNSVMPELTQALNIAK